MIADSSKPNKLRNVYTIRSTRRTKRVGFLLVVNHIVDFGRIDRELVSAQVINEKFSTNVRTFFKMYTFIHQDNVWNNQFVIQLTFLQVWSHFMYTFNKSWKCTHSWVKVLISFNKYRLSLLPILCNLLSNYIVSCD